MQTVTQRRRTVGGLISKTDVDNAVAQIESIVKTLDYSLLKV